jgi:hypothetical protein
VKRVTQSGANNSKRRPAEPYERCPHLRMAKLIPTLAAIKQRGRQTEVLWLFAFKMVRMTVTFERVIAK